MAFTPRKTAPSTSSKYWKHTSAGGVNECIKISGGSCIPNCVGYAWGRFYEILGKKPKLAKTNAETWYLNTADGYQRGKTPRLGAVICWAKGKAGNAADGAGHVAIVEEIYSDGSILTSNSAYKGTRFYMKKLKKGYAMPGYTFQGFIYNPAVSSGGSSGSGFVKGKNYTLLTALKVRSGAGTNYSQKTVSQLTAGGKKAATSAKGTAGAVLKAGTVVTCLEVKGDWIRIPSGWICGKNGSKLYIIS